MKLHCFGFFILAFLLFSSTQPEVEGSGRCILVMDPTGCNLSSCKQQCFEAKNGNGACIAHAQEGYYDCVCYYNC